MASSKTEHFYYQKTTWVKLPPLSESLSRPQAGRLVGGQLLLCFVKRG